MPSPIGHSLMGYIIFRVTSNNAVRKGWKYILLCLIIANAADFDFVPGLLMGTPNRYHHGISHSIGFAAFFAAAGSFLLSFLKREAFLENFIIIFCLYCSHIVLDYLSIDTSVPYGVPLFWPLSNEYYISPFAFLPDIWRASTPGISFFLSLASFHNLWAITAEFILLSPGLFMLSAIGKRTDLSKP